MTALPPELAAPPAFAVEQLANSVDDHGDGIAVREIIQRWRIDGTRSAAWAMAHVAKADAAIQELQHQAGEWYRRIDDWLEHETAGHERARAFFVAHLERYALDVREADPDRKSVTLPGGVVRTTAKAASVKVIDEKATLAWALEHLNEAVSRDPRLRVGALKEHVKPIQVITAARFTHSCGDVFDAEDVEGLSWPEIGSEVNCSECGEKALLGNVEVLATRWVTSVPVPGVAVEAPSVTAKVVVG